MKNKSYTVKLKNGYTYTFFDITLEEARKLVKEKSGKYLQQYSSPSSEKLVYLLDNGTLVRTDYVDAILYESLEDYLVARQTIINKKLPKHPFKRIIYTAEKGKVILEEISKKEATKLVNNGAKLIKEERDKKIYTLEENAILMLTKSGEQNSVYPSLEEYKAVENLFIPRLDKPIMLGRNPYGEDFPNHVDELSKQLFRLLKLPLKSMDFSRRSLFEVEKKMYNKTICDEWTDPLFLPLIAYIGQVVQKEEGGGWEMVHHEKYDTWSPNFRKTDGKLRLFYKDLDEIFDVYIKDFIAIPKC